MGEMEGRIEGVATIPRWIDMKSAVAIHGFADASELAYGAVVYVQCKTELGMKMYMLASKSRIAPVKTLTIPRLELCAGVLLSKLMRSVIQALNLNDLPKFCWSDSTITLHWLKREDGLKTFVHNRVQKIKELPAKWGHIRSELNPADMLSRGIRPGDLIWKEILERYVNCPVRKKRYFNWNKRKELKY